MAWRETLSELRGEVEVARTQSLGDPVDDDELLQEREELYQLAASLQIAQLLVDVNEVLLGGSGIVESSSDLEYFEEAEDEFDFDDGDDEDDEEEEEEDDEYADGEELRFSLSWEEAVECAIDVELGKADDRIYLLVNGEEVRQQREVLERAVIEAFKEEIDL